jgi:MFS family permease
MTRSERPLAAMDSARFELEEVVMEEIPPSESIIEGRNGSPVGDLSVVIKATLDEVTAYLRNARARQRRMLNLAVLAGALATALAASPAIGGKALSDWLSATLELSIPGWQVLCALAAACSLVAAIATQLLKSENLEERVARAESVRARLGILNMGRITGSLTPAQVSTEYAACVELISFI